jgi:CheY-like chemotaxis protein
MTRPAKKAIDSDQRLRVLVVEDNFLIAEMISDLLEECGCAVIGPAPSLEPALELLDSARPEAALLDINLSGTLSYPIADALESRRIPFVFLSGYDDGGILPPELRAVRKLPKPFERRDVEDVLECWKRMLGS